MSDEEASRPLRRGWTTGTCATAAAKAACAALLTGDFPDPVAVRLPGGQRPAFALARTVLHADEAAAAVVKDAGDDPDVTHGAVVVATVRRGAPGSGLSFRAGPGVGIVTRPGLPLPPGEPAINPVPRRMIAEAIAEVAPDADFVVEIGIDDGTRLAQKTLNPRLGIVGGLSVLGTTGIVVPFSCAAWIETIHRGIDVARALGHDHVLGATGHTSETTGARLHALPETALIDMGDFVGGMLKYLRRHPVAKVTVAGGPAKMTKLGQGMLDVHSKRGFADLAALADLVSEVRDDTALAAAVAGANTVAHAFQLCRTTGVNLGDIVAEAAWESAARVLARPDVVLEILVVDRDGSLIGRVPFTPSDHASPFPVGGWRKRRT